MDWVAPTPAKHIIKTSQRRLSLGGHFLPYERAPFLALKPRKQLNEAIHTERVRKQPSAFKQQADPILSEHFNDTMSSSNNKTKSQEPHKFLRLPDVKDLTGLSKSTIYSRMAQGKFPKQVSLGSRLVVWIDTEIDHWLKEQVSNARG